MNRYATLHHVENGHKEVDVSNRNRYIFECLVPVEEGGKLDVTEIPWANIRIGYGEEYKSPVAKDISFSLYSKDGSFHTKHKGIRIIAKNVTLNNGKLFINFGESNIGNDNS